MRKSFTPFYLFFKPGRKIWVLLFCCFCCCKTLVFAVPVKDDINVTAARIITGTVTDQDGAAMAGVSVILKGTRTGTVTDLYGKFSIDTEGGTGILVVSYIGFKTREISIGGSTNLKIILSEDQSKLDEVVVTGFSKQPRETISTSVSKLDEKALANVPYANVTSALQGTLAGVRAQSGTGQPGEPPLIIVRGSNSINNPNGSTPLYVVDGVIRPQLYNINSADVESIQVLKDAAATAIYGARGGNGVVIVTTKSGKAGKFTVNVTSDYTLSDIGKSYDLANAQDYLEMMRLGEIGAAKFVYPNRTNAAIGYGVGNNLTNTTAFSTQYLTPQNAYKLQQGWQQMPDPLDPTKTIIFSDTDFQSLVYRTGKTANNFVSVSGGTEKTKLYAGIGYLTNQGTVITTKYNRLSFNLNGDIKASDKLSFFGRLSYQNSQQNNPNLNTAGTFYRNAGAAPTTKFTFEDGTLAPGFNQSIGNPLYQLNTRIDKNSTDYTTMTLGSHWDILPGLSFDPSLTTFRINGGGRTFQKAFLNGPNQLDVSRIATENTYRWIQNQIDATLSYRKTFATNHNIDSRVGFSYYGRQENRFNAVGRGATTDIVPTLNASATPVSVSSVTSDQLLLGYFGNINYDYKQKYLLTVNARLDGASNLGTEYKYGLFPGVSAGWNVEKENFWKIMPKLISRLKIRGSYGVNGSINALSLENNTLGDYLSQGTYGVGSIYGGAGGIISSIIPNPDLKWERSETVNGGVDIGLFNGRLNFIFDAYRKVTSDLLTNLVLPPSTGFGGVTTNLSSLENKGIELEVNANILPASSKFRWNAAFNMSRVSTRILKLPNNGVENNRIGGVQVYDPATNSYRFLGGLQEGGRPGEQYDRKQISIYATDAEAATAPTDTYINLLDKTKYGGDTKWQDTDGNGMIDSRDQVYMGNFFPNFNGGFSNTFSFKGFDLYLRTDFTTGHIIYNWAAQFMEGNLFGDGNTTQRKIDRAWKQQGDITDMPRMYWGGERFQRNTFTGSTTSGSSFYNEKGDFLCVRELTLSYNFPQALLSKIKVTALRLNVTANNLYYFTNYSGLNPELGGQDDGRYAVPKNFIFGLNLTL